MFMNHTLVDEISQQTELIFYNMSISMKTCERNSLICDVQAWRYFYHTLHSCDKWFINPSDFTEPSIHTENLDKVDIPTETVLSDEDIWSYFHQVKNKIINYLSDISDDMLSEKPIGCEFTRLELILGQFRHFMCHIGILNGITIANKGKYPMVIGLDAWKQNKCDGKLYDE